MGIKGAWGVAILVGMGYNKKIKEPLLTVPFSKTSQIACYNNQSSTFSIAYSLVKVKKDYQKICKKRKAPAHRHYPNT
jgi:hypothetical protein